MIARAMIGVYDSLAEAEKAELHLEEAYLPVGQMSLIAARMEGGEVKEDLAARDVADAIASTDVRPSKKQIAGYKQALSTGKYLLIFNGDAEQVASAYRALRNTPNDQLALF